MEQGFFFGSFIWIWGKITNIWVYHCRRMKVHCCGGIHHHYQRSPLKFAFLFMEIDAAVGFYLNSFGKLSQRFQNPRTLSWPTRIPLLLYPLLFHYHPGRKTWHCWVQKSWNLVNRGQSCWVEFKDWRDSIVERLYTLMSRNAWNMTAIEFISQMVIGMWRKRITSWQDGWIRLYSNSRSNGAADCYIIWKPWVVFFYQSMNKFGNKFQSIHCSLWHNMRQGYMIILYRRIRELVCNRAYQWVSPPSPYPLAGHHHTDSCLLQNTPAPCTNRPQNWIDQIKALSSIDHSISSPIIGHIENNQIGIWVQNSSDYGLEMYRSLQSSLNHPWSGVTAAQWQKESGSCVEIQAEIQVKFCGHFHGWIVLKLKWRNKLKVVVHMVIYGA